MGLTGRGADCARNHPGPVPLRRDAPDDPNDIVHEHRRELRPLRVFGAWTNLTDLRAGNTLDTLVTENGRSVVKHYLQDVGSTFGMGANGPHEWDEGWEHFYQGDTTRRRLLSFGFALSPWQTAPYTIYDSVGRFEGDRFDPTMWKPHTATAAYIEMRPDDAFWAARRVMAFTDDGIRAIVRPDSRRRRGRETPRRRAHQAPDVGRAYITTVNPVVDPALSAPGRDAANAAVERVTPHRIVPGGLVHARQCDRTSNPVGETRGRRRPFRSAECDRVVRQSGAERGERRTRHGRRSTSTSARSPPAGSWLGSNAWRTVLAPLR
jgi:hypothetical protein